MSQGYGAIDDQWLSRKLPVAIALLQHGGEEVVVVCRIAGCFGCSASR